ncbi:MAG: AAA family ATPase [Thermomicrobiales bacterium]
MSVANEEMSVTRFRDITHRVEAAVAGSIVGQADIVRQVVICLIAGGHGLLEGAPGLGKTMLVKTLAQVLDLRFSRIQFTPDLMPADITGTNMLMEEQGRRQFLFQPGPIFAISSSPTRSIVRPQRPNRRSLKRCRKGAARLPTQCTISPSRSFVLATQNPIEMEGTYPLPEAQLDRFFFKMQVDYPAFDELREIIRRSTASQAPDARNCERRGNPRNGQTRPADANWFPPRRFRGAVDQRHPPGTARRPRGRQAIDPVRRESARRAVDRARREDHRVARWPPECVRSTTSKRSSTRRCGTGSC